MSTRVERARRRRHGLATYRVVRYADDFVVMVYGSRQHTEAIREQIIPVLASVGLRLSEEKTTIAHLDEGLEFLGFRIQRQTKRGSRRRYVYTWVAKRSLTSIKTKIEPRGVVGFRGILDA
jgi:RNA-directed DNA polymerase